MFCRIIKWLGASAILTILGACSVTESLYISPSGVYATTTDPECGDVLQTKAIDTALRFTFTATDDISIYAGANPTHMVFRLNPTADNPKRASFTSEYFSLLSGITYYSFYPDVTNPNGAGAIEVSFAGQAQSADNSTAHLAAYDFQSASAAVVNNAAVFPFTHKVSWLKATIQATTAATLTSITVSADEGVANTATFNLISGDITYSRAVGDVLTVSLGGTDGISTTAGGSITAYITIPAQTYTNLTITATDTDGNEYVKVYSGEKSIAAGKYYIPTLQRKDIPEDTPFTNLSSFGVYSSTNTVSPVAENVFRVDADQMSYGILSSGQRTFNLVNTEANEYALFTVTGTDLQVGEEYAVSADINGVQSSASYKVVKLTDECVWLENKTDHTGYIFAIE